MKVVRFSEAKVADELCHEIFNNAYEACPRVVDFNPEWTTSMGFFDNAIQGEHALKIKPGRMLRTVVPTSGRRALFIGTHLGVVAVYERLTGNDQLSVRSIFFQSTRDFEEAGYDVPNQPDDLCLLLLLGDKITPNIGMRIDRLVSYINTKERTDDKGVTYTKYTNLNSTIPKVNADQCEVSQTPKAVKSVNKVHNVMRKAPEPTMDLPKGFSRGTFLGMGKHQNGVRVAA